MTGHSFILATAGHVDHGKSALVKALTGTDPDRLPEEKARGITIDLGFAHLELEGENTGAEKVYSIGLIDVPGHEDFVKNMVAGVGAIDLALLVVAADDGWMPQTEEHLQILAYLGVRCGVVALTKSDLVANPQARMSEVRQQLANSPLADAPIVPTSTVIGTGLAELKAALTEVINRLPAPRDIGRPRLAVDRAFTLHGLGSVVTGTLTNGHLSVGQEILIQPLGLRSKVRSIQTHGHAVDAAAPGMRTALNLPDVPLGAPGQPGLARGQVIALPGVGSPSLIWEVRIQRSPRSPPAASADRAIRNGVRLHVHHGSAAHAARLRLLAVGSEIPGAPLLAQLIFDRPAFAWPGDRFILRDWAERRTLAGGEVLVVGTAQPGARKLEHLAILRQLADAGESAERWLEGVLRMASAATVDEVAARTPFSVAELRQVSSRLVTEGRVIASGQKLILRESWAHWIDQIRSVIAEFHRISPEKPGLPVAELRSQFANLDEPVFQGLLGALALQGIVRHGANMRATNHELRLPPQLMAAGARVRKMLAEKPLEPPARKELAPDPGAQAALRFLIEAGEAIDLGPELALNAAAYDRAVTLLTAHLRQTGAATVSELRPVLGTTRRILIPLLEHFDRIGITIRRGDQRSLKQKSSQT